MRSKSVEDWPIVNNKVAEAIELDLLWRRHDPNHQDKILLKRTNHDERQHSSQMGKIRITSGNKNSQKLSVTGNSSKPPPLAREDTEGKYV